MDMKKVFVAVLSILAFSGTLAFVYWYFGGYQLPPHNANITNQSVVTTDKTARLLVAFIGDQGHKETSRAVLTLIKNEGAGIVLHQGDFDYANNPDIWDGQINTILGPDFPYFASVGNHDVAQWSGYQEKLLARLRRLPNAHCTGEYGVNSLCTYGPLVFILSGVGTLGVHHLSYLENALTASTAHWKVCSWHKDQHLMQTGEKADEVGWEPYEICRQHGAIIATAHEHSYARTYLMSQFNPQTVATTSSQMRVKPGQTIAFVSGLAGQSVRDGDDELVANPWWAVTYNADNGGAPGALFCDLNDTAVDHASCYFKDINGRVPDHFELEVSED